MKHLKTILIVIFLVSFLADVGSTLLFMSNGEQYANYETHPLFVFGVNIYILFAIKTVAVLLFARFMYGEIPSERVYYFMLGIMFLVTFAQFSASYGNYEFYQFGQANPTAILPSVTQQELIEYSLEFSNRKIAIPFILGFIPYLLFEWTAPYQKFKKRRLIAK